MNKLKPILAASILLVSGQVSAGIVTNIGGKHYEWLELSATAGKSRLEVEALLNDSTSSIFGYQYASNQLTANLFQSYAPWDGVDGRHSATSAVTGLYSLMTDFGILRSASSRGSITSIDENLTFEISGWIRSDGIYGTKNDCTTGSHTCMAVLEMFLDQYGNPVIAEQIGSTGWDGSMWGSSINIDEPSAVVGSFLVRPAAVPAPAALLLFGTGLLGLIGFSKRRKLA